MKKKIAFLVLISLYGLSSIFGQITLDSGLVAKYYFNGNAIDESGNGNNGIVHSATLTTNRFGFPNSAYSFNGTNTSIEVTNTFFNVGLQDYTISAWFCSANVDKIDQNVFNTIPHNGIGIELNYNLNPKKLSYAINSNPDIASWDIFVSEGSTFDNFQNDKWYHWVFQKSGDNYRLYINGNLESSSMGAISPINYNCGIKIGQISVSTAEYFEGKLDDYRIYNRSLDSTEIMALYKEGLCFEIITVTDTLIINTNITGFNPITYQNTIKIFPNPANDHITIDYGDYSTMTGYTLKIVNSMGQIVFTSSINQQQSYINLSSWSGNGIYFVHVIDDQNNTIDIKKIILQ